MDKRLRPPIFDADASNSESSSKWKHWKKIFESYVRRIADITGQDKLDMLVSLLDTSVYVHISESQSYEEAIRLLDGAYIKPVNEIYARHRLNTSKQKGGESLQDFYQRLKKLSADCNFAAVSAVRNREAAIRDAFIAGLSSGYIRQRLLEENALELRTVFDKAQSLEDAQKNAESYVMPTSKVQDVDPIAACNSSAISSALKTSCFFCGGSNHKRALCRARSRVCFTCGKQGHFAKLCRSPKKKQSSRSTAAISQKQDSDQDNTDDNLEIATFTSSKSLNNDKVNVPVMINGVLAHGLIDTGAKNNHVDSGFCRRTNLKVSSADKSFKVDLAVKGSFAKTTGSCTTQVELLGRSYAGIEFLVMDNLLRDVILGREFLSQHKCITFNFGGPELPLQIGTLQEVQKINQVRLFEHMTPDCKPIAAKSRKYSNADRKFIDNQVTQLLKDGIIEASKSPWRAQLVIAKSENHKKRMCVDYSQTVNKFTHLDAYPLPNMRSVVNNVAQYKWYSKLDLRSAYHQIGLVPEERKYTAFEANGQLYQFKRIPFGLKNAVPCFQRVIDAILQEHDCKATFAYLDDITVCGKTCEEHDQNLTAFLKAAKDCNLTLNENKCVFATESINLLGYNVSHGILQPDPDRVKPVLDLPLPKSSKELQRIVGMFSYYAQWIPQFSEKLKPLIVADRFPLPAVAVSAFKKLQEDLAKATLEVIDEKLPFVIETDASENAISATLNQQNRPVAFFSRMLNKHELKHSSIEKEAAAIVEAVRKWSHFLSGRHFSIVTDQKSVTFMYDATNLGKIKNDKVLRWRTELSEFDFDIIYRSGKLNKAPDRFLGHTVLVFMTLRCIRFMLPYVIPELRDYIILCV